ncbi:hypothetical protein AB0H58_16060 [Nocardia neocaledoniensis]|uniref:hypothetical protein n=1 Tax=Nocardia neocaledoniensis TaxID=236511 RepID=UPI002454B3E6|nr:hypothetical protein [Nocardia neocaledoniensis]
MTDYAEHDRLGDFVASKTTLIRRHAGAFAEVITDFQRAPGAATEYTLLDELNHRVEQFLADYVPPSTRRVGDSLVFAHLYRDADPDVLDNAGRELACETVLTALFAAEVEFRGPLRLSRTQSTLLAEVYEELGEQLSAHRLPAHAALAYRQAYRLHTITENPRGQDRCGLNMARAKTRARSPRWRRLPGTVSDLLCGYGYRPFLLLAWIALEIAVFVAVFYLSSTGIGFATATRVGLLNFLNPVGTDDLPTLSAFAQATLIVESYAGIVSTSVFFALLVRQLFRL